MVSEGLLVKSFSPVFCSPQSGIFSCQCLDLGRIQTSPSGTPAEKPDHCTYVSVFSSPPWREPKIWVFVCLFVFNYACRSGWGVCGEWVPQIFLLAAIRLVSHSSMVQEPLSYSLHFSQKELFSEWLIELMSL